MLKTKNEILEIIDAISAKHGGPWLDETLQKMADADGHLMMIGNKEYGKLTKLSEFVTSGGFDAFEKLKSHNLKVGDTIFVTSVVKEIATYLLNKPLKIVNLDLNYAELTEEKESRWCIHRVNLNELTFVKIDCNFSVLKKMNKAFEDVLKAFKQPDFKAFGEAARAAQEVLNESLVNINKQTLNEQNGSSDPAINLVNALDKTIAEKIEAHKENKDAVNSEEKTKMVVEYPNGETQNFDFEEVQPFEMISIFFDDLIESLKGEEHVHSSLIAHYKHLSKVVKTPWLFVVCRVAGSNGEWNALATHPSWSERHEYKFISGIAK